MTKKTYRNLLAITLLAVLAMGAVALPRQAKVQRELREARAALTEDSLLASGWTKAPSGQASDVPLPSLQDEVTAADTTGSSPVLALNADSEAVVVTLPLPTQPDAPREDASTLASDQPAASTESSVVPLESLPTLGGQQSESEYHLTLKPRIELRADLNEIGNLFYTGKQFVKFDLKYLDLDINGETEHPLNTETTRIALGETIQKAFAYYQDRPSRFSHRLRPVRHWRVGWSGGVGVGFDPLTGEAGLQVGVLYGVQF